MTWKAIDPERSSPWLAPLGWMLFVAAVVGGTPWLWPAGALGLAALFVSCISRRDGFLLIGPNAKVGLERTARFGKVWLWRVIYVAIAFGLLTRIWSIGREIDSIQELANRNFSITVALGWTLYAYVVLLTVQVYAGAIPRLRETKQWEVLRTTDLRPRELVLGLWLGRFSVLLEPIIAVTPVLMVLPLYGGVSPWLPMAVLGCCIATAFGLGMFTLWNSLSVRGATGTTGWVMLGIGLYVFLSLFARWWLEHIGILSSPISKWLVAGHPISLGIEMDRTTEPDATAIACMARYVGFHVLAGLGFLMLSARRIRLMVSKDVAPKIVRHVRDSLNRSVRRPVRRPKMDRLPIAWWERSRWLNHAQAWVVRWVNLQTTGAFAAALTFIFLFIGVFQDKGFWPDYRDDYRLSGFFLQWLIWPIVIGSCAFLFPPLFRASRSIVREKSADTWDALLLTPYDRSEILRQKWIGLSQCDRPAFLIVAACTIPMGLFGILEPDGVFGLLVSLVVVAATLNSVGLLISVLVKSPFQATLAAVILLIAAIFAGSIFASIIRSYNASIVCPLFAMGRLFEPQRYRTNYHEFAWLVFFGSVILWSLLAIVAYAFARGKIQDVEGNRRS